jgi:8-oxo-dGTP pyrophosphatase MutT (NUDIX family)
MDGTSSARWPPTPRRRGRIQGVGGSLELVDVRGDTLDLDANIRRELREELGLDPADASVVEAVVPSYLKSGGENDFFGVVFRIRLCISSSQAVKAYQQHVRRLAAEGMKPEFDRLVIIDALPEAIDRFLKEDSRPRVDYLANVLRLDVGKM